MLILLFTFMASTFYVVKHGVGKEKLYFLYPLGTYLAYNLAYGVILHLFPAAKGALDFGMGLVMLIALVAMCILMVAKVRKNGMQRVMDGFRDGIPDPAIRKFEL